MNHFGSLIKDWRKTRGLSQMELGFEADISSKHISFLETGRSQPSREMIIRLSNSLDIPLSERNVLFSAAGFSEAYTRSDITQPEMAPVKQALEIMLSNHEPYPAVVFDWDWNIVMMNQTNLLMSDFIKQLQPNFPQTNNILEMLFDPNGFRPFVKNWQEVACVLLQRLHREKIMYQDRHSGLLEKLMSYPGVPDRWKNMSAHQESQPMVDVILEINNQTLRFFSTLASFGTPIDITMQELTIESYFPSDEATKAFFVNLPQLIANQTR
ncbi:helix-turn-helix transcriptional regulator [Aliikangiella marina]|uniref:Helix-turn-helix transcriptional regulator n=1 Tax=Aliikangiella marina TaxID=1712262 RepID=A0A545T4K3_9GAMM|nr:helix-turn-helix transcriptional regulator [Aliikangiella marina]TQV72157.1 helix-turn-helix transcriptional regulator [Aliikangiella marina]